MRIKKPKIHWEAINQVLEKVWVEAAALSYGSLFSLIPFMTIVIVILQIGLPKNTVMQVVQDLVFNTLGTTFDMDVQFKIIDILQNGLGQFYSWQSFWVGLLSSFLFAFVAFSLIRRIQLSCFRIFGYAPPKFKIQMQKVFVTLLLVVLTIGFTCTKPFLRHFFPGTTTQFIPLVVTCLQFAGLALILRSFYPLKLSYRAAFISTFLGYWGWKGLGIVLSMYAIFSLKSRSVFGPWAILPLFLTWLYFQFILLYICLGLLREFNRLFRRKKKA